MGCGEEGLRAGVFLDPFHHVNPVRISSCRVFGQLLPEGLCKLFGRIKFFRSKNSGCLSPAFLRIRRDFDSWYQDSLQPVLR